MTRVLVRAWWCVLACLLVVGACTRPPPEPIVPSGGGGALAVGGASAGGEASSGGEVSFAGAAGQPTATGGAAPVVVDWPECNPATQKARPVIKHTLGRKHVAMKKRVKASYNVLDLPDAAWVPLFTSLDQKELGACTGFATLQCRLSAPWAWGGAMQIEALNAIARDIYSGATKRDPFAGSWPPTDTGSLGQYALDEAVAMGIFASYDEVFTFDALQVALQKGPCITGTDWPDGFFAPDRCGAVKQTGAIAGGHEWTIHGIRYETKQVLGRTSWDDDFGVSWHGKGGFFWVPFGVFVNLILAGGDMHCPHVANDNFLAHREAS